MFFDFLPVFAVEQPKGSIRIQLTDGGLGTSKEGVKFEYAKVAELLGGKYYLLDHYSGTGVDLNQIEYANELDETANILNEYVTADGKTVTDEAGYATISDLEVGVYLLRVSDKAGYENVTPVLITIPTWNEVNGYMDYEVTVIPKHSADTPEVIYDEVKTGDDNLSTIYIALAVCSGLTFISVFCNSSLRKRMKKIRG